MNRKAKNLMLGGLTALLFVAAACEKELPAGEGKKVTILFSVGMSEFDAAGEMARNAGAQGEPETAFVSLEDDMYMQATLVPDEKLRVAEPFTDGQKIRFMAFLADGTQKGSELYSYSESDGQFHPDGNPLGVDADNATDYRFVAYSYFGTTGVEPLTSVSPDKDLVWGRSAVVKVDDTEPSRRVTINMTHQFAQVKVQVRSIDIANAVIDQLTGVTIDGGKTATLTPFSGVAFSGTVNQGINIASAPGVNDVSSTYRTVTPVGTGALPVKVRFGTVKVSTNSTIFPNKTVEFYSPLAAGSSYTLVVDIKQGFGFAYSNIYWNGTKLTFDKSEPAANDVNNKHYQGVFFMWGSLIGISPVYDGNNTLIYVPNNIAGRTWKQPAAISSTSFVEWQGIPYVAEHLTATGALTPEILEFMYTHSDFTQYTGDICTFIDGDWRMPTSPEFNYHMSGGNEYDDLSIVAAVNASGTGKPGQYRLYPSASLPYSGYISFNGGTGSGFDEGGWYWSSTHSTVGYAPNNGLNMHFKDSYNVIPGINQAGSNRREAFPIRCVKK